MPIFLRDLGRNLAWGGRIPLGLPVSRLNFRIGVPQLLALFVFSALADMAVDWGQRGPDAIFTMQGLVGEVFFGAILMLLATLLARAFRQPDYALALPVIVLASEWPLQIARALLGGPLSELDFFGEAVNTQSILTLWMLFWLWRAAAVSLAPPRPHYGLRSVVAAAVLMSPMWLFAPLLPDTAWWTSPAAAEARDTG